MKSLYSYIAAFTAYSFVRNDKAAQPVIRSEANTLYIYDIIDPYWGVSGKAVVDALDSMTGDITVRINSPGGSVDEGVLIYNSLLRYAREKKAKVTVEIDALAASIATVIAMAGTSINIAETAMFMIHNPWTFAGGEAKDFRTLADLLDLTKEVSLIPAYMSKTSLTKDKVAELMDDESWMSPTQAKEYGFVTGIRTAKQEGKAKAALHYDLLRKSAQTWDLRQMGKLPKEFENLPRPSSAVPGNTAARARPPHGGPVYFGKPDTLPKSE